MKLIKTRKLSLFNLLMASIGFDALKVLSKIYKYNFYLKYKEK